MMKTLLFRELYLSRKRLLAAGGSFAVISLLAILTQLSVVCGNLSAIREDEAVTSMTYYICLFVPSIMLFMYSFVPEVILNDLQSGWDKFSRTLPQGAVKLASVKYIFFIGITAAGLILSLVNMAAISAVSGTPITEGQMKMLAVIFTVMLYVNSLSIAVIQFFRNMNAVYAFQMLSIVVFGILPLSRDNKLKEIINSVATIEELEAVAKVELWKIVDFVAAVSPFVIAAVLILGFVLTVAAMKFRK